MNCPFSVTSQVMLLPGGFTKNKAAYLLEVLKELETVERLKCFKSNQQKVVPAYR